MGNNLSEVDLGTGFNVTDIAAGTFHTCALSTLNTVKCWGGGPYIGYGHWNNRGDGAGEMGNNLLEVDLGTGFNVTDIAAGDYHTCALSTLNKVKCWGGNGYGQLGYGDNNTRGDGAGEMGNNLSEIDLGTGFNVTDIVEVDLGTGFNVTQDIITHVRCRH
eukprot:401683_1